MSSNYLEREREGEREGEGGKTKKGTNIGKTNMGILEIKSRGIMVGKTIEVSCGKTHSCTPVEF